MMQYFAIQNSLVSFIFYWHFVANIACIVHGTQISRYGQGECPYHYIQLILNVFVVLLFDQKLTSNSVYLIHNIIVIMFWQLLHSNAISVCSFFVQKYFFNLYAKGTVLSKQEHLNPTCKDLTSPIH